MRRSFRGIHVIILLAIDTVFAGWDANGVVRWGRHACWSIYSEIDQ